MFEDTWTEGWDERVVVATASSRRGPDGAEAPTPSSLAALGELAQSEVLDAIGRGQLSSIEILELAAAFAHVQAWAAAGLRVAAAALERRSRDAETRWLPERVLVRGAAAEELSVRLGVSGQQAQRLVGEGVALTGSLFPVREALETGAIDSGKARVLIDALADQEDAVRLAVCDEVLPDAPLQSQHTLARRVQRAVVAADSRTAAERHCGARAARHLSRVRTRPDGMASVTLVAPLVDVTSVEHACELAARAARASGDGRTLEQLRADALTTLAAGALERGRLVWHSSSEVPVPRVGADLEPLPLPIAAPSTAASSVPVSAPPSVPVSEREPSSGKPALERPTDGADGRGAAFGVVPMGRIAVSPTPSRPDGSPSPASEVLPPTGRSLPPTGGSIPTPGSASRRPGPASAPADTLPSGLAVVGKAFDTHGHRVPLVIPRAALDPAHDGEPSPADEYREAMLGSPSSPDHPHACGPPTAVPFEAPPCRGTPAELLGFGPLAPAVARELAAAPPPWVRVLVSEGVAADECALDGPSSRPRQPGTTGATAEARDVNAVVPGYDIPDWLRCVVQVDHPTCVVGICGVPSTRTDCDHVVPHPLGPTCRANLRPGCRRHHVLKTHAGFHLALDESGASVWTTPLGQRLRRDLAGRVTRLAPVPPARAERGVI